MTVRAKIKPDAAPSSTVATVATAQWRQNCQKTRDAVPLKESRGATPATPNFDGTCNGLKGRGIVFNSTNPRANRFMHIRREITEYVGNKYTDGGDIHWAPDRDKMKTHTPPLII